MYIYLHRMSVVGTVSHSHFATMRNENVVVAQSKWIQQCRMTERGRTNDWQLHPAVYVWVCVCLLRRGFLFMTTVNSVKRHCAWLYVLCVCVAWCSFSGCFIHRSEFRSIVCARLWIADMVSHRFPFVIWIHTRIQNTRTWRAYVRIFPCENNVIMKCSFSFRTRKYIHFILVRVHLTAERRRFLRSPIWALDAIHADCVHRLSRLWIDLIVRARVCHERLHYSVTRVILNEMVVLIFACTRKFHSTVFYWRFSLCPIKS